MPTTKVERSAASEAIAGSFKLVLNRIPFLSFHYRRRIYKSYVDSLGVKAFDEYGVNATLALCFSKSESRKYKNTERELDGILKSIPRLNQYRGVLREHIRANRKKYGLKV